MQIGIITIEEDSEKKVETKVEGISKEKEAKVTELENKAEVLLSEIMTTNDADIIMPSLLLIMGALLQVIMLINFKQGGYLTNVEQGEIIDDIIKRVSRKVYPMAVEGVQEFHQEWFEKKKGE